MTENHLILSDSNRIIYVILESLRELVEPATSTLMEENINAAGSKNLSPQEQKCLELLTLENTLIDFYGETGAKGIGRLAGRSAFTYLLRFFREELRFHTNDFRLQPTPRRLQKGIETLAKMFSTELGLQVEILDQKLSWDWKMQAHNTSICGISDFVIGLLQEFCSWASGGHFYRVLTDPQYSPGSLTLRIDKKPLD